MEKGEKEEGGKEARNKRQESRDFATE